MKGIMKMNRINSLAVVSLVAAAFTFSSCEIEDIKGLDGKYVNLKLTTENNFTTKSADVQSETFDISNEGVDMFMTVTASFNDVNPFTPSTKGEIITESSLKDSPIVIFMDDTKGYVGPSKVGDYYSIYEDDSLNGNKLQWSNDSQVATFKASVLGGSNSELSWNGNSISYDGAEGETNDMLMAYTTVEHDHSAQNLVKLHFYHALALVKFKFSDVTVKSVSVNKVAKGGTAKYYTNYEVNHENGKHYTSDANFVSPITWETSNEVTSYVQSSETGLSNVSFFIVPQGVSAADDVTISFTVVDKDGKEHQVTAAPGAFGTNSWVAGWSYTYKVSSTLNDEDIDISIAEKFDGTTKSDVQVTNEKPGSVFVRASIFGAWYTSNDKVYALWDNSAVTTTSDWVKNEDGYYYYQQPLLGNNTETIIKSFSNTAAAPAGSPEGTHLEMRIAVQAIEWSSEYQSAEEAFTAKN